MRSVRRDGFTLVELAIVVVIIGIMAASIVPGMATTSAGNRASGAAEDLLRMARRAQSETSVTGLAHVLAFDDNDVDGYKLGRLRLFRSSANSAGTRQPSHDCNMADWNFNDPVNSGTLVDWLDMVGYNLTDTAGGSLKLKSVHLVRLLPVKTDDYPSTTMGAVRICYQPDGRSRIRNGDSGAFGDAIVGESDVLFNVTHTNRTTGQPIGVPRRVVFAFGGNARIRL